VLFEHVLAATRFFLSSLLRWWTVSWQSLARERVCKGLELQLEKASDYVTTPVAQLACSGPYYPLDTVGSVPRTYNILGPAKEWKGEKIKKWKNRKI
jgi:hypothetical protein